MTSFNILSTKKLEPGLKEQLNEAGFDIDDHDFINIEPVISEEISQTINALSTQQINAVFTSASAVEVVADHFATSGEPKKNLWKIFCLAGKTKTAVLKTFNENQISVTSENATELAKRIIAGKAGEVIFFCGDQRREELPSLLKQNGIIVNELVVYKTNGSPITVEKNYSSVLFFSPSAVKSFFSVNQLSDTGICFAIGNTTADEIKNYTYNKIIIADFPSQEAVVSALINYYKQTVQ